MAYDEELADRVRGVLTVPHDEKRMFGGLAFLVHGQMAVAVSGSGGLMVRVDPEQSETLLGEAGASDMVMGGNVTSGWLRVASEAVADDDILQAWVDRGLARVEALRPS